MPSFAPTVWRRLPAIREMKDLPDRVTIGRPTLKASLAVVPAL